ncbi:phosphate system positive regulatory protein pho81 [Sorochytrium milnesiophthora]
MKDARELLITTRSSYKVLKKVINSLENHSDAGKHAITVAAPLPDFGSTAHNALDYTQQDHDHNGDSAQNLQSQKASFFYKLERELEKVNRFYLSKEAEIKVRLRTLLDKKRIIKEGLAGVSNTRSLKEAFLLLQQDLVKLQSFVEMNATGFRKILKKWDKRSKSSTKELYLSRQIEIQPCFNSDVLTEITDIVATNVSELMQLEESTSMPAESPVPTAVPATTAAAQAVSASAKPDAELTLDDFEPELVKSLSHPHTAKLAQILERRAKNPHFHDVVSRVFVRACGQSSLECVKMLLNSGEVNITYADEINERTCMHETAILGNCVVMKLCAAHGAAKETPDAYGRVPLHYAATKGAADCVQYLVSQHCKVHVVDHDGFTPLIYAIINGHTQCVALLLDAGASLTEQPHHALSLAAQYGHLDIAKLLLSKGAPLVPVEGLHPLHLTARQGHVELCRLLTQHGVDIDASDKYYNWTPLFYAASEGHLECVKVLLDAGAKVDLVDENDWKPIVHALYRGHTDIAALLAERSPSKPAAVANGATALQSATAAVALTTVADSMAPIAPSRLFSNITTTTEVDMSDVDLDAIPSLSLPPPIIPFRIYGHNYLDRKYQIQISLRSGLNRPSICMFGSHKLTSLKLVLSCKPDTGSIPYSVILPADDAREVFTFQVDSMSDFSLHFDIFPTYGTKAVGKAVALSSVFFGDDDLYQHRHHPRHTGRVISNGHISVPLFDMFRVVGEIAFDFNITTPFSHPRLEVGGQVETYWKSTQVVQPSAKPSATHHNPLTSSPSLGQPIPPPSQTSPFLPPASHPVLSLVTASSLAEEYIHVAVQITLDQTPVIYPAWYLPLDAVDVGVSGVNFEQFVALGAQTRRALPDTHSLQTTSTELAKALERSFLSLEEALKTLPPSVGILLEIKYPSAAETSALHLKPSVDINTAVDLILKTVYDHVQLLPGKQQRSLVFSSFNPNVCTAVNWKQPNYAVFFNTHAGYTPQSPGLAATLTGRNPQVPKRDGRCRSIKEAIRFAKTNNLLGLLCEAAPLIQAPELIHTVKESGLVLTTFGKLNEDWASVDTQESQGVDATYLGGVLRYSAKRQNP